MNPIEYQIKYLKELNIILINRDQEILSEFSLTDPEISEIKIKIDEVIRKADEISPFTDLLPFERNLFEDIIEFLNIGKLELIRGKLVDLARIIQERDDKIKVAEEGNSRATKINILSIAVTIIFGIFALMK